jgi:GcrA cell cycle regulator
MDWIMPRGIPWTDDDKKVARDLWMAGYSSRYIGVQLNRTRRSIIGLLWRLNLLRTDRPANPVPYRQEKRNQYTGRKSIKAILGQKRSDGEPVTVKDVPMPEPSVAAKTSYRKDGKIKLMDLRSNSCRWPISDPQSEDFGYCGAATDGVCPYCRIHKKIAFYQGARVR